MNLPTKFGGGTNWAKQGVPEMTIDKAVHVAQQTIPAMIQPAKMTAAQFKVNARMCITLAEQRLEELHQIMEAFLLRWEDFGPTRELAAKEVFGISWHSFKKKLARVDDKLMPMIAETSSKSATHGTIPEQQTNQQCLSQIEESRKSPTKATVPHGTEPEEKPRVQTATEELGKNVPAEKPPIIRPPIDVSGCVIPQSLLALRERRQEVTALEHHASALSAFFVRLQTERDPLWQSIKENGSVQHFAESLKTIRYQVAECTPDVVCPQCIGVNNGKPCSYCVGTGWIAKVRWDRDYVNSRDSEKLALVEKRAKNL